MICFKLLTKNYFIMARNNEEISSRILLIRQKFCADNNKEFAEKLGITPQYASNICNGTKAVGEETLEKILNVFPEVNRAWLFFGEGDMLRPSNSMPSTFVQSSTFHGQTVGSVTVPAEAWAIIQAQSESLRAKDEQISRLITLIEKNSPTYSPSQSAPTDTSRSGSTLSPKAAEQKQ